MKHMRQFTCILLSLLLLLPISNVSAAETQTLFTGKIETDSAGKSIDLTNIDIDILWISLVL